MNLCANRLPWVAAVSVILTSPLVAEDDQVFLRRGGVVRGTVTDTSPVQVTVRVGDQNRTVSVSDIRLVSFGDEPVELREARSRAVGGKFAQAKQDLERVSDAGIASEWVQQDFNFYQALVNARLALTTGGDQAAASEAMLSFVRGAATSHHFFQAAEVLGDLAVAQGDFASAVRYYGSIANKAPWPEYQMRAAMLEARALLDQGNVDEAQAKYQAVIQSPAETSEARRQKLFATIGRARAMAESTSQDQAVAAIEKVIAENESTDIELFGRAYNALGDCFRVAGKPKEALRAYLHVDVLFYADPEIHAESLHWIAKLWEQIGKADRAAAARSLLESRYGGSRWAKMIGRSDGAIP